ncbi:hypothetical protein FHETE_2092 [Fusarium heterosporum]|uniref:Uncharacterized protein n=1 Tax=Fusarium heterosporum TaxID=42747 RepID=A0A8H5TUX8_FUSHE|nr:hypothetical protein FHETE_2092 [Fusarium heterosporum]
MVKRFNGFDFWEQRFKANQPPSSDSGSGSGCSDSGSDSDASLAITPDVSTNEDIFLVTETEQSSEPQEVNSTYQVTHSQPLIIKSVAAAHDVRNSISFLPSLDHYSQSADVLLPNSYEEKEEFLTVVKRNDSRSKRNTQPPDTRRSHSGTIFKRQSPLTIDTTNLSPEYHRQARQRHSTLPDLPAPHNPTTKPHHKHTIDGPSDCAKCLTLQTDQAFEALANALGDKRQEPITPFLLRTTKNFEAPVIRSPKPLRPRIASQHLQKAQHWADSQRDFDSSTASSLSSPMSPMMPINLTPDTDKSSLDTEIIPMGCNLDHDLGDFLEWEARNVCAYGYGTNRFSKDLTGK